MDVIKKIIASITVPALLVMFGALPVHAQTNLDVNGSLDTQVEGQVDNTATGSVDTSVDAQAQTDVDGDADATAEGDNNAAAGVNFELDRSDISVSADADSETEIDTDLSVEDVVGSDAGFQAFVRQMIQTDASVKNVSVSDDEVSLTYSQRGKLFGFIPLDVGTEVRVMSDGEVVVDYPWYSGLTTSLESHANLKADIESSVDSILAARAQAQGNTDAQVNGTSFTTEEKILLVGSLYQSLQAQFGDTAVETQSTVETEATSSVNVGY